MYKVLLIAITVLFSPFTFSDSKESPAYDIVMVERGLASIKSLLYPAIKSTDNDEL